MLPYPSFSLSPSFGQGIRVDHAKHEGSLHKSLIANELFTPHAFERKIEHEGSFCKSLIERFSCPSCSRAFLKRWRALSSTHWGVSVAWAGRLRKTGLYPYLLTYACLLTYAYIPLNAYVPVNACIWTCHYFPTRHYTGKRKNVGMFQAQREVFFC